MTAMRGWTHHIGVCECGKRSYVSRSQARRKRRDHDDPTLRAYQCEVTGWWHLGHLRDDVRHGLTDRATAYGGRAS